MLLKILVYGYVSGTRSSRKLADRLREDVVFMWLSGRQEPDFRTISDFRKDLKLLKPMVNEIKKLKWENRCSGVGSSFRLSDNLKAG